MSGLFRDRIESEGIDDLEHLAGVAIEQEEEEKRREEQNEKKTERKRVREEERKSSRRGRVLKMPVNTNVR